MVKIFTIVTGETWNIHRTYVERVSAKGRLTEVQRLDESDVILVFCPILSQHGPDIDAALKEIPANKPAVLVVMNHTCYPNRPVYDSSDYLSQRDVLSVDCVFHESSGLFGCTTNDAAVEKTLQHIKKYSESLQSDDIGLREETGVSGGIPQEHQENMQAPHEMDPNRDSIPQSSSSEVTVPPTAPSGPPSLQSDDIGLREETRVSGGTPYEPWEIIQTTEVPSRDSIPQSSPSEATELPTSPSEPPGPQSDDSGLLEETGASGGISQEHRENMQAAHGMDPNRDSIPQSSSCEVTVPSTAPSEPPGEKQEEPGINPWKYFTKEYWRPLSSEPMMVKIYSIVTGETWNAHRTYVERVTERARLTEVQRLEESDVILVFCPVASRHGPDIDAALKEIPANKPAVLVVMNHTCHPNRPVYDSSDYVSQSDVLSVDCVFHESSGLFMCPTNEAAVEKTLQHIKKYSKIEDVQSQMPHQPPKPLAVQQQTGPQSDDIGLREETGASGETPHEQSEIIQTPRREDPSRDSSPQSSPSEATELANSPSGPPEEIGVSGGIPHEHRENMQAPHGMDPNRDSIPQSSSSEVTVSPTAPSVPPGEKQEVPGNSFWRHPINSIREYSPNWRPWSSKPKMVKIFTIVTGETWNAHRTYVERVIERARLTEVQLLEESDVILVFCPVASLHGPDIDAALKEIPANKPAVLVVMNHTCHPNRPVYDSSDYVSQSDVLSVDCVFHEYSGLFRCPTNEAAVEKTLQHIKKYSKDEKQEEPGNSFRKNSINSIRPLSSEPMMVRIYSIVTEEAWNARRTYVERVAAKVRLTEVQPLEESDVLLVFQREPGIDAALKEILANKPAVLVVMNRTDHPNCRVYDSSNYVSQSDVLSVDCVFNETSGLFSCPANEEAVEKTLQHLKKYSKGLQSDDIGLQEKTRVSGGISHDHQRNIQAIGRMDPNQDSIPQSSSCELTVQPNAPSGPPATQQPPKRLAVQQLTEYGEKQEEPGNSFWRHPINSIREYSVNWRNPQPSTWFSKPKMVKIFSVVTGETWDAHRTFVESVGVRVRLTEVQGLVESDVLLVFCPVGSHHAADINAALKKIPANKPAVLVVMNHTCHPNRPVYDSSDDVSQSDVLSVDCVFHEYSGLFSCPTNDKAVEKTLQHIKKYS